MCQHIHVCCKDRSVCMPVGCETASMTWDMGQPWVTLTFLMLSIAFQVAIFFRQPMQICRSYVILWHFANSKPNANYGSIFAAKKYAILILWLTVFIVGLRCLRNKLNDKMVLVPFSSHCNSDLAWVFWKLTCTYLLHKALSITVHS